MSRQILCEANLGVDSFPITVPGFDHRRADCQCPVPPSIHLRPPDSFPGDLMTCAFVPPYLLRHLAETADGAPDGAYGNTLRLDARFRARRAATARRPAGGQEAAREPGDGTRT